MAIQHRRGNYADFDPTKMVAGEPAVVLGGDPTSSDGKAAYIAFGPGSVKKLATAEDMRDEIYNQTQSIIQEVEEGVADDVERAESAAESVTESAAQIAQNTQDITDIKTDLSELVGGHLLPESFLKEILPKIKNGTINRDNHGYMAMGFFFTGYSFNESTKKIVTRTSNSLMSTQGTFYLNADDIIISLGEDYVIKIIKFSKLVDNTVTSGYTYEIVANDISDGYYVVPSDGYYFIQFRYSDNRTITLNDEARYDAGRNVILVRKNTYKPTANYGATISLPIENVVPFATVNNKNGVLELTYNNKRSTLMPTYMPAGTVFSNPNGYKWNLNACESPSSLGAGVSGGGWKTDSEFTLSNSTYYSIIVSFADDAVITLSNLPTLLSGLTLSLKSVYSEEKASNENLFMKSIVTYERLDATYEIGSLTYNTTNNKFYTVGHSKAKDGTAWISAFADWNDPTANAMGASISTGHSNDMTYDPVNNRILVACGGTGSSTAEANLQRIIKFVNPETFAVTTGMTLSQNLGIHGIEYIDGYIYIRYHDTDNIYYEKRSLDLVTVHQKWTVPRATILEFLGMEDIPGQLFYQGMAYNPRDGLLYNIFSIQRVSGTYKYWGTNLLLGMSLDTFEPKRTISFTGHSSDELQGYHFTDVYDYAVQSGYGIKYCILNSVAKENDLFFIPPNSDLNDYVENGRYFCNNATNAATMINSPVNYTGFNLRVYPITYSTKGQEIEDNNGNVFKRIMYVSSNTWVYGAWTTVSFGKNVTRKTIAFMGDSVTAGSGTNKCFHQYIGERFDYVCKNYGYGGSGYVRNFPSTGGLIGLGDEGRGVTLTSSNKLTNNTVVARLAEVDKTTTDAVVIFAGTNDWAHGDEISVSDFESGLDNTFTYYQTNFGTIPLVVVTPIHRKNDTVANATTGKILSDYVDIIIRKCREYSIPCVDAMTMSGLHPDNAGNDTAFFTRDDTSASDGLHPNHLAHMRIAACIAQTLKEVCNYDSLYRGV